MLITKGYKYRIYPNRFQAEYMDSIFGSCRFVYNYFLALRSSLWKEKKESISPAAESRMLTVLKRSPGHTWLSECDSMALQESLKDLDKAYKNFFGIFSRQRTYSARSLRVFSAPSLWLLSYPWDAYTPAPMRPCLKSFPDLRVASTSLP